MRSLGQWFAAALATMSLSLIAAPASAAIFFATYTGVVVAGTGSDRDSANPTYDTYDFF